MSQEIKELIIQDVISEAIDTIPVTSHQILLERDGDSAKLHYDTLDEPARRIRVTDLPEGGNPGDLLVRDGVDDYGVAWRSLNEMQADPFTYAQLLAKKTAGELIPGAHYRLTDYQCIWRHPYGTNPSGWSNTGSNATANVAYNDAVPSTQYDTGTKVNFDLVLTAKTTTEFFEDAYCMEPLTQGPGTQNIPYTIIRNTKVLYSFDNDATKYAWAVPQGKGVIYRMVDSWNNDVPYDFWNIEFWRYSPANCTWWYGANGNNPAEWGPAARARAQETDPNFPNWGLYDAFPARTNTYNNDTRYVFCYPAISFTNAESTNWSVPANDIFNFKFFISNTGFGTSGNQASHIKFSTFNNWTNYITGNITNNVIVARFANNKLVLNNIVFTAAQCRQNFIQGIHGFHNSPTYRSTILSNNVVIFGNNHDTFISDACAGTWIGQFQLGRIYSSPNCYFDRFRASTAVELASGSFLAGAIHGSYFKGMGGVLKIFIGDGGAGNQNGIGTHNTNVTVKAETIIDFRARSTNIGNPLLQGCDIVTTAPTVIGAEQKFSSYAPNLTTNIPANTPDGYVGCIIRNQAEGSTQNIIFSTTRTDNSFVLGSTTLPNMKVVAFAGLGATPSADSFISSDANNALVTGTDSKLFVPPIAGPQGPRGATFHAWSSGTLNALTTIPGAIVGDYIINMSSGQLIILGEICQPGDVVLSTANTLGTKVGNFKGPAGTVTIYQATDEQDAIDWSSQNIGIAFWKNN